MPALGARRRAVPTVLAATLALAVAGTGGCGGKLPDTTAASGIASTTVPTGPTEARDQLAARAAAAKDRPALARYIWSTPDRPDRTVIASRAADRGWRVDIHGGAVGGTADVSVVRIRQGLYQCALAAPERGLAPYCVRVAGSTGRLPAAVNPRLQHVFADWLEVFTDRRAALAVSTTGRLPGVTGDCFAVEANSASLAAPLDVGIYCYDQTGTLTGARLGLGTLTLATAPTTGPTTISLPGPVTDATPLPMASPPPPSPSATPSPSTRAVPPGPA